MNSTVAQERPHWSDEYHLGSKHQEYVVLEGRATRITIAQPLVIPGLLQTPAYAEAATSSITQRKLDDPDVKRLVDVRLRRQQSLAERMGQTDPPQYVAVVDEAALRRPIGDAEILRSQLTHLIDLAGRPHITVVVVPTRTGGHPALAGAFELLQFADGEPDLVYLESLKHDAILRDDDAVAGYRSAVEELMDIGLSGEAAEAEIRRIRDEAGSAA